LLTPSMITAESFVSAAKQDDVAARSDATKIVRIYIVRMPFGQWGLHLEGGKPVPHSRHLQKAATSPAIFWQSDSGPLTQRMERSSMRGRAQLVAQTLQLLCVPAHQDRLGAEPFQSPRECRTNSAPRTPYCPEMQTRPARGPPTIAAATADFEQNPPSRKSWVNATRSPSTISRDAAVWSNLSTITIWSRVNASRSLPKYFDS